MVLFIELPETEKQDGPWVTRIPLELLPRRCPFCGEWTIIGHENDSSRRETSNTNRSGFAWACVVPGRRHLPYCPTGRHRPCTTASAAGNKRGSYWARRVATGSDPSPTSQMPRGRQSRPRATVGGTSDSSGNPAGGEALAGEQLEHFHSAHHPCLGLDRDPPYSAVGGEKSVSRQAIDELKQQIPLLDYLKAHGWRSVRRLSCGRWMGLCPLHNDHKPTDRPRQEPVLPLRLWPRRGCHPLRRALSPGQVSAWLCRSVIVYCRLTLRAFGQVLAHADDFRYPDPRLDDAIGCLQATKKSVCTRTRKRLIVIPRSLFRIHQIWVT